MAKSAMAKMVFNLLLGDRIDAKAHIHTEPLEQSMPEKFKSQGLRFVDAGIGNKNIVDNYGTLGSATDRGYLSKEQVKQTKRDNKVKLSYDYLQQFEHQHHIPALAPEVLARMQELVDKE